MGGGRAKISRTQPRVATTSPRRCPGGCRSLHEMEVPTSNMAFATTLPLIAPTVCATITCPVPAGQAGTAASAQHQVGQRDHGVEMGAADGTEYEDQDLSTSTVAVLFWSTCRPTSLGESCWAAIPEPTPIVTSRLVPSSSAMARRHSGGVGSLPTA